MFLTYCAYSALIICLLGTGYRIGRWFALPLGPEARSTSALTRAGATIKAVAGIVVHPRQLMRMAHVVIVEVLFQVHILRQSPLRWAMHMMLFYSMLLLLLMHTFDDQITARLFTDYASTLNPFLFLRNLLGLLLIAGVIIAWTKRRRELRQFTQSRDRWLLALLGAIVVTGVALEATQIISATLFDQMVVDYMGSDDPEEIEPLKAFWAARFDVAFAPMTAMTDPNAMETGRELHESYCAACHSRPASAVLSYPVALAIKPVAEPIDRIDLATWLWYAHYLISCLALALLPFSKLFHLLATPVNLMTRALGTTAGQHTTLAPVRRALGLDACTHCGVCTQHCAVAPIQRVVANPDILPSEKIGSVAAMASGRVHPQALTRLAEGSFICTSCGRCTRYCPSGIDLQDLWEASKADLVHNGHPQPQSWIQRQTAAQWADTLKDRPDSTPAQNPLRQPIIRLADNPDTFWACVQCSTCTNVCPVVAISDNPQQELEMTPQQIMNLMRLQLKDRAIGSRMVWNCVTCYKCQEHCPQGVRVADILYELRNEACRRLS